MKRASLLRRLWLKLDLHWCAIGWHSWGLEHVNPRGFKEACRYCPTDRPDY